MKQEIIKYLEDNFQYNPHTGDIKKKDSGKYFHLPELSGSKGTPLYGKKIKRNLLCWILAGNPAPCANQTILHRNLDEEDCRMVNMQLISKEAKRKLNRLLKNARKHIKLRESATDAFDVKIEWLDFDTGAKHRKTFNDHTAAKRAMRSLLRELLKELEVIGVNVAEAEVFLNRPRM